MIDGTHTMHTSMHNTSDRCKAHNTLQDQMVVWSELVLHH